jgi:tetratricopeptide (TPR) repeat protein
MPDTDKSVFISYRRSTSSFIARAVFMDLRVNGFDVFLDVETIDSGAFDNIILNQIAARTHFVLILTPGALDRCHEPGDWLRREVEHAMQLERNIVPLLVNDFTFAGIEHLLLDALSTLPRYNAVKLYHEYFDEGMERLRKRYLKQPEQRVEIMPTPTADQSIVEQKIEQAASEPTPTIDALRAEAFMVSAILREKLDHDGRIADYSEAIRLKPDYVEAYNSRGNAYARKNDYQKAFDDYQMALGLNPDYAEAYYNRANIYQEQGDFDAAISDYSEAYRRVPENVDEIANEGLRYARPQYTTALVNRAAQHFANGDFVAALGDYRRANDIMPAWLGVLAGMAVTRHAMGHVSEAVRLWKHLMRYDADYKKAEWVQWRFSWDDSMVEEARKLIARLS